MFFQGSLIIFISERHYSPLCDFSGAPTRDVNTGDVKQKLQFYITSAPLPFGDMGDIWSC